VASPVAIVANCLVDLSDMRKVTVVPEKKYLIAQGGALISDLDQAAAEYGLATGTLPYVYNVSD
jgi:FAD/FMN-containing dehydrogenase